MIYFSKLFLIPFLVSGIAAYLITPPVIRLVRKLKLIDDPEKDRHPKKIHKVPTPRGGGLAIFLAFLLASLLFLPLDKHLSGIIVGALILVVMGLLDDRYNLNPYLRIAIQFLAASAPIISGIGISFLTNPFNGILDLSNPRLVFDFLGETRSIWILSDAFALIWIVALMNFLNMGAKGIDGQLPGVAGIAALTVTALSFKFSADIAEWPVTILASITAGAFLGFLPWNFYPQKIMPSFSGSSLAGYLLGVLSILSTTKVGTLLVVLGVPLIDTGYTVIRRVFSGKSPVWGDTGHLHHRLLQKGLDKKQVVYFYWAITFILGLMSLFLNSYSKLYTIIGVTVLIGGLLLWLTWSKKWEKLNK